MAGHAFTMKALFADMIGFDARDLGEAYEIPMILIHGDADAFTPPGPAKAWLDGVVAPAKAFHVLPGQGHMAPFLAPDRVLEMLLADLEPVTRATPPAPCPG
jgi:pimeloyl-ACP methyl ester carboxylesterase